MQAAAEPHSVGSARPEPVQAVPLRHPGRRTAVAVLLVLGAVGAHLPDPR